MSEAVKAGLPLPRKPSRAVLWSALNAVPSSGERELSSIEMFDALWENHAVPCDIRPMNRNAGRLKAGESLYLKAGASLYPQSPKPKGNHYPSA